METPEYRLKLIQQESERLGHYLHALHATDWHQPSACQHWAVHDVVGHLILGAELYTQVVMRGLQGDVSPLQGLPAAGSVNAATASPLFAQWSVARRQALGTDLLSTFHATCAQLQQVLTGVQPQAWATPCYHPAGVLPVQVFVDLRLTEVVMHGWDIRSRFEPAATLAPESLATFLDVLTAVIGWAFWPDVPPATPVRYRFALTGTPSRDLDIVVGQEGVRLEASSTVPAQVYGRCRPETFVFVISGRLSLADAVTQGRLSIEGDSALVTAFTQWFRGV